MQNNLNRWYDGITGRWLSQDPSGFAGGDANLYRYCANSPTDGTDPTGLGGGGTNYNRFPNTHPKGTPQQRLAWAKAVSENLKKDAETNRNLGYFEVGVVSFLAACIVPPMEAGGNTMDYIGEQMYPSIDREYNERIDKANKLLRDAEAAAK